MLYNIANRAACLMFCMLKNRDYFFFSLRSNRRYLILTGVKKKSMINIKRFSQEMLREIIFLKSKFSSF